MPTFVHFDITADDINRTKQFYEEIFQWKFLKLPPPMEYYLIQTQGLDGEKGLNGGLAKRTSIDQRTTNFIGVKSIDETFKKIEQMGGKILESKKPVPGWGHLAVFQDPENNVFGIWENEK